VAGDGSGLVFPVRSLRMTTPERYRKLDQATEDEIVKEYLAEVAIKQIARKFDVAQSTIYYVLARNGVEANRTSREVVESHDLGEIDRNQRLLTEYLENVEHRLSVIEAAMIKALQVAAQAAPMELVRHEWEAQQQWLQDSIREIRDVAGMREDEDLPPQSDTD
jgi:transposase-like protein